MKALVLDIETQGRVSLTDVQSHVYACDPGTRVLCVAYAWLDPEAPFEVRTWRIGESITPLCQAIAAADVLYAHNAEFERSVLLFSPLFEPVRPFLEPVARWRCTAAMARAMALPASLSTLAEALGIQETKDPRGYAIMMRLCRPDRTGRLLDPSPEELDALVEYCAQDVRLEALVHQRLLELSATEQAVWRMTVRMNDRGVRFDREFCEAALRCVSRILEKQNALIQDATGAKVLAVTQVARLKAWLSEQGHDVYSLNKAAVQDLLLTVPNLSENVRTALQARQRAGRSSIAKLNRMLQQDTGDQRLRGLFIYHGASTGRWTAVGVQPQNFVRSAGTSTPEETRQAVLEGTEENLDNIAGALRSMLCAAPNMRLYGGDFSQIEARLVGWLSRCQNLVDAFRTGNPYEEVASLIFGRPITKASDLEAYTIGKCAVLGCGFGLGATTFAAKYCPDNLDLARAAVSAYRTRYPEVGDYRQFLHSAALFAVKNPGKVAYVFEGTPQEVRFAMSGSYLLVRLPSGRRLFYPTPSVEFQVTPWDATRSQEVVTFAAMDKGKWARATGYGGLWIENITQATARDILASAMLRLEDAGYLPVLTVHDEVVTEAPASAGLERFRELLLRVPPWAPEFPLAAEVWEGDRWRK